MYNYLIYFFMGISLSIDAFSIALSIGNLNINKKINILLALTVGLFHFIMPNLSNLIIKRINTNYIINTNIITASIFIILGIIMLKNINNEIEIKKISIISIIIIAFSVSIDSFSVGIALSIQKENTLVSSIIFSQVSLILTYLGSEIGQLITKYTNNKTKILSPLILIIIGIKYLLFI